VSRKGRDFLFISRKNRFMEGNRGLVKKEFSEVKRRPYQK